MSEAVTWREAALNDLARIVQHIFEENPIAARQIGRELLLAGDSLTMFPRRGHLGRIQGTRELLAVRPYIIVYEVTEDGNVAILRVWHGAQSRRE